MFYSNQTDKWDWNLQWKEMLTCSHLYNSQELKDPYVCQKPFLIHSSLLGDIQSTFRIVGFLLSTEMVKDGQIGWKYWGQSLLNILAETHADIEPLSVMY